MDEQLRGLSRSDDPGQRARYLRAALRAGELERAELDLAAHLGDPGAQLALEQAPDDAPFLGWVLGFRRFGQAVFVRMLCAALRAAEPADPTRGAALRRILEACEAWAAEPGPALQQAVEDVIVEQLTPTLQETVALRQNPASWQIVTAAQAAAGNTRAGWEPEVEIPVGIDIDHPDAGEILARFAKAGASLAWGRRDGQPVARLFDCGFLGAGGIAKALGPLSPLKPIAIVGLARSFRERAAPAVFASRQVGEEAVRKAICTTLRPDLGFSK